MYYFGGVLNEFEEKNKFFFYDSNKSLTLDSEDLS